MVDVQTLTLSLPHRGRWILRSKRRREFACPGRGGGCEQSEQTEGLKKKGASHGNVNPSVNPPYGVLPAPRPGSLLALCKHHPKAVPVYGESVAAQAVTKGERLGDADHCEMFPLSLFAIAHRQLPRKRWRLLVRFTNSHVKPALKGEVDASVTSRRRGCIGAALVCVNPSVNPPCGVLPAPRTGSLLV